MKLIESCMKLSVAKVSCIRSVKKLSLAFLLLTLGANLLFAQSKAHRCEISITDFNIDDRVTLGNFTTEVNAEKLFTKAFQFPDTELFVTASVLYMQASPYTKGSPPVEMILTLVLGKKAYSSIETEMRNTEVITNARAKVPLKSFESSKVETIFLGKPQPVIITLACKK